MSAHSASPMGAFGAGSLTAVSVLIALAIVQHLGVDCVDMLVELTIYA